MTDTEYEKERSFEEWKALAEKNGFKTFSGRNGFMDGHALGLKESKARFEKIIEANKLQGNHWTNEEPREDRGGEC